MTTRRVLTALGGAGAALAATLAATLALAGSWEPEPVDELAIDRVVRAVSLDVRGVVPTDEELLALEAEGEIPEAVLDEWLHSDAFIDQAARQHRNIVWNRIAYQGLLQRRSMRRTGDVWFNRVAARYNRGDRNVGCSDRPADLEAGETVTDWIVDRDGYRDEGWVEVEPYWAPGTTLKVCAFDAQIAEVSPRGTDCTEGTAHTDPGCGCGPNLQWCAPNFVLNDIVASMDEEIDQSVRTMLETDAPYDELLTTDITMVNAPLAHFYRHLAPFDDRLQSPLPADELPVFDTWDRDTWVAVTRDPVHSGILTSSGWLMRHQTHRGRANRFYGGFLCQEFLPQPGGIGGLEGGTPTPDLTLREGCRDCHARLEPWAAYWGRWSASGNGYLSPEEYPRISEECEQCATTGRGCTRTCRLDYLVTSTHPDEDPFLGWFQPYTFLGPDHQDHPDIGPEGWVEEAVADGSLATCTARNVSGWLLGPDTRVPDETLQAWTEAFEDSGHDYRTLVRTVIQSDVYRRVR